MTDTHGHDHTHSHGHATRRGEGVVPAAGSGAREDASARWDRFYLGDDGQDAPLWSGRPNPTLVAEVTSLPPGRALDVGCGEGADAIWLAQRGWVVTGLDPSGVALGRAERAAASAGVDVTWRHAELLEAARGGELHGFDLVTAHYGVVGADELEAATAALVAAVEHGGTLLVVHHELDAERLAAMTEEGLYHLDPIALADHLDTGWDIEVRDTRARTAAGPTATGRNDGEAAPGAGHDHPPDVVLRARRRLASGGSPR
jgi:SAM-dependent methyltransferase